MRLGQRLQLLTGGQAAQPQEAPAGTLLRFPAPPTSSSPVSSQPSSKLHDELLRLIELTAAPLVQRIPPTVAVMLTAFLPRFGLPADIRALPRVAQKALLDIDEPTLRGALSGMHQQLGAMLERTRAQEQMQGEGEGAADGDTSGATSANSDSGADSAADSESAPDGGL